MGGQRRDCGVVDTGYLGCRVVSSRRGTLLCACFLRRSLEAVVDGGFGRVRVEGR